MWNRIVLICSGMAFGWALVNRLSCPDAQMRGQAIRMGFSAAAALIVVVWLGTTSWGGALVGLAVFAFCAALAYAAHARQFASPKRDSGPPAPQLVPTAASRADGPSRETHIPIPRVILIADDEPARYDGPAGWSYRLQQHQMTAARPVGGLLFTLRLAAIRSAYRAMPTSHPYAARSRALADLLQERCGSSCTVALARLQGIPHLREALRAIDVLPQNQVLIIPMNCDAEAVDTVRSAVTLGQLREQGVRIVYAPNIAIAAEDDLPARERLDRLLRGQPVPDAPPVDLVGAVEAAHTLIVNLGRSAQGTRTPAASESTDTSDESTL